MLNCVIEAVVLPSSTPVAPRSRGLHSHRGGPRKHVLVSLEGDEPVRETRKYYSRKPVFGTGVGIEMISPWVGMGPPWPP